VDQENQQEQVIDVDALRAFEVSLDQLLPINVPGGSRYSPSTQQWFDVGGIEILFVEYGLVQTLVGWVLIPVAVTIIAGALRRQTRL
jgi:hypothetical protein